MSKTEKMTNKIFRRSLILKIIVASFALLIVVCFSVFWIDNTIDHGSFNLDEGMEETLKELGPTTKFIRDLEVEFEDGIDKSIIKIKSNSVNLSIDYSLSRKADGYSTPGLYEYPDIDAYLCLMTSGYFPLEKTIRCYLFGEEYHMGVYLSDFEKGNEEEAYKPPKYRHYFLIEIKKESEDNCYWIYAEMNHPEFANDVMKEAVRQINAYVEPDEQT